MQTAELNILVDEQGGTKYELRGQPLLMNALAGSMDIVKGQVLAGYMKASGLFSKNVKFDNGNPVHKNSVEVEVDKAKAIDALLEVRGRIDKRLQAINKSEDGQKFKIDPESLNNL